MELDIQNITPLDLRILKHLKNKSITREWEPLYNYLVNNFNTGSEDTQKIILIYTNQENENIDFNDVNEITIPKFDWYAKENHRMAFAEFINVHPVFIKPFGQYESHLESFKLLIPAIHHSTRYIYYVGTKDEVYTEAEYKIREKIEDEGWDFFSHRFLLDYVEINQQYLDYNVTEIAAEEYESHMRINKDNVTEITNLLKKIDKYDEYEYLNDTFDELTEIKKQIDKTFLGLDNVISKLEKEKKIIEIEIERLGDITDYGDDEDNYSTDFEDELEDLENKLNRVDNRLEEAEYEYNQYYKDYDSLLDELEDVTEELNKYKGENFKNFYISNRKEILKEEYIYDIEGYVDELSLTLGEAIADNVLEIGDEDYVIYEAIQKDGPEYFIGDLTMDSVFYDDKQYYILW